MLIYKNRENQIEPNKNKYTWPHNMLIFQCISNYYNFKILNPKEVQKGHFASHFAFMVHGNKILVFEMYHLLTVLLTTL